MIFLNMYSVELRSVEQYLVKQRSNSNLHSRNTLFWLKKWLKRYYGKEGLGYLRIVGKVR